MLSSMPSPRPRSACTAREPVTTSLRIDRVRREDHEVYRTVRLAALADTPSAFGSTLAGESALDEAAWVDRAGGSASGSTRVLFLARQDGDVVGLAGGYRDEPNASSVELFSMWTSPAVRRTGVGHGLVVAVIEWARQTGASQLRLWVTDGNTPAIRLYDKLGFHPTGERKPLPSDPAKDELAMVLGL